MDYASVDDYRAATGDAKTDDGQLKKELSVLSARLRAEVGMCEEQPLSNDALTLASALVIDAARKKFVIANAQDVPVGSSSYSFSADGFSESWSSANASGSAYWDRTMLVEFKQLVGYSGQRIGFVGVR